MTYIGDKIKEYRMKRGITQGKLAELSGIHPVSIRKYEAGMMAPKLHQIQRIADALEINTFLLQEETYPKLRMQTGRYGGSNSIFDRFRSNRKW